MEPEAGMEAMAEYVVWREHPELANESTIKDAVDALKSKGLDEIFESSSKDSLSWAAWSKLL